MLAFSDVTPARREFSCDEIASILSHMEDASTVACASVLSRTWRLTALEQLTMACALHPAHDENQRIATCLRAKDPTFVAAFNDVVVVSECNLHRLVLFSISTGERLRSLGKFCIATGTTEGLNSPKGLAFDATGRYIFVADRSNHRVLKLDAHSGAQIAAVGARGYGVRFFKYPQGLCFADTAAHGPRLFVCDYGNDRIVVLDPESLEWCGTFGEAPTETVYTARGGTYQMAGRLSSADEDEDVAAAEPMALPAGIVADAHEVFVCDASNHTVHVYAAAHPHAHLRTLARRGTWDGALDFPWGIALVSATRTPSPPPAPPPPTEEAAPVLNEPAGVATARAPAPPPRRLVVAEGAASGGRYGRLQLLDAVSGAHVQTLVMPERGRLSGVCATGDAVCVVDHTARCVRVLSKAWQGLAQAAEQDGEKDGSSVEERCGARTAVGALIAAGP